MLTSTSSRKKHVFTRAPKQEFLDSCAVLKMVGRVSRIVYLEAMWEMEERYPNRGWKEQAKALEKWYDDREIKRTVGEKPPDQFEFKDLVHKTFIGEK